MNAIAMRVHTDTTTHTTTHTQPRAQLQCTQPRSINSCVIVRVWACVGACVRVYQSV